MYRSCYIHVVAAGCAGTNKANEECSGVPLQFLQGESGHGPAGRPTAMMRGDMNRQAT